MSVQQASYVNEAFHALKNPLSRANYLLKLRGIVVSNETADLSPDFLEQQIELREQLADIRNSQQPHDLLKQLQRDLDDGGKRLQQKILENFDLNTSDSLLMARTLFYEMQFLYRIRHETDEIEEELLD